MIKECVPYTSHVYWTASRLADVIAKGTIEQFCIQPSIDSAGTNKSGKPLARDVLNVPVMLTMIRSIIRFMIITATLFRRAVLSDGV